MRGPRSSLRLAVAALTLGLLGCRPLPPRREPPPAFAGPVIIELAVPADRTAGESADLLEAAEVATRRLNASRRPDERPVAVQAVRASATLAVLVVAPGAASVGAPALTVRAAEGPAPPDVLVDPDLPAALVRGDLGVATAVYDATIIAGLAARRTTPEIAPSSAVHLSWGSVEVTTISARPHVLAVQPR